MELRVSPAQNGGMRPSIALSSVLAMNALLVGETAVRVRVFDEVHLDTRDRDAFEAKAREILSRAGITSNWLNCPCKPEPGTPQGCADRPLGAELIIRIRPCPMIGHDNGLGSAVTGPEGGVYGSIYYPRVKDLARQVELPVPVILALATIHEIGHLILGGDAHFPLGIMRPGWGRKEVEEMVAMNRYFNGFQSRELQKRVMARRARS